MPRDEKDKIEESKRNTVKRKVSINFNVSEVSKSTRTETINGREFIVAPGKIMPVASVMNRVMYPDYATFDSLNQWNGRPLTLSHPIKDVGDNSISANNPITFQSQVIGTVFNASIKDSFVHAELYIDVEKTKTLENGVEFLEKLNDGVNFDVSTGMSVNAFSEISSFNNQEYDEYVTSFTPDHLAILLNERGACSWNDGAGMPRTNADNQTNKERVDMKVETPTKENASTDEPTKVTVDVATLQAENAKLKAFFDANEEKVKALEVKENELIQNSITSILEDCKDESVKTKFNSELVGLSTELLGFLSEKKAVVVTENSEQTPVAVVENKIQEISPTVKPVENASSEETIELDI